MRVLGIDPGLRGGIAVCGGGDATDDLPVCGSAAAARIDVAALAAWIKAQGQIDHAMIERAQAHPDQGRSSIAVYMRAVGAIEATVALCGIPISIIEPGAWKKSCGLLGRRRDKESSRQRALQLFPCLAPRLSRKLDHGRGEALLIARHGLMLLRGQLRAGPALPLHASAGL
jgi:hypothetical protein